MSGKPAVGPAVVKGATKFALVLAVAMTPLGAWASPPTPPAQYPWGRPGCPCATVLHPGTPESAGLVGVPLQAIDGTIHDALARRAMPGAVILVARRGVIAKFQAYGYGALYTGPHYDRMAKPVPMQKDTMFDLASVSKLFTATAVMQLWDEGKVDLDAPVAKYLPGFAAAGKGAVTVRELLTHTSGMASDPPVPLYEIPGSRQQRIASVLRLPLEVPPGTRYIYSDSNFITLGALVEKLSGEREDAFLRQHLTGPLRMTSTMYDPPASLKPRIAASEYQPWTGRGLLWGQVEDENAWALDGVAGHAGLFSDAHDLAVFGQMMLNDGSYDGQRVLSEKAVRLIETNWNGRFPRAATGLGWSIDRGSLMGALTGPGSIGHEGYTGTMITVNKPNDIVAILLTNRVHPTRVGASIVTVIGQVNTNVAAAIPVAIPGGGEAWFSGYGNFLNRQLTANVTVDHDTTLSLQTWYRTAPSDGRGLIEVSPDGRAWTTVGQIRGSSLGIERGGRTSGAPADASDNGWQTETYPIPAGTHFLRFVYRTVNYGSLFDVSGRGWYIHGVTIGGEPVSGWNTAQTGWLRRAY